MSRPSTNYLAGRIRIWVIAIPQLVRECLGFFIEKNAQFELVAATGFPSDWPEAASKMESDVVVIYLEPGDRAEIVKELHENLPKAKIVAITDGEDLECSMQVLKSGAVGIVRATQGSNLLLEAIRKAHEGEIWLNQELLANLLETGGVSKVPNKKIGPANDSLTPREIEVISMIGKGLKSKIIADRLSISEATVRHHLSSIYGKLGVEDRLNLIIYAINNGLVELNGRGEPV